MWGFSQGFKLTYVLETRSTSEMASLVSSGHFVRLDQQIEPKIALTFNMFNTPMIFLGRSAYSELNVQNSSINIDLMHLLKNKLRIEI